jgi:hypothetical protein
MSLAADEGEAEQIELRSLQSQLETTQFLVTNLSQQLSELRDQVSLYKLYMGNIERETLFFKYGFHRRFYFNETNATLDSCGLRGSMSIPQYASHQMSDKRHNTSPLGAGSTREHQKVTR